MEHTDQILDAPKLQQTNLEYASFWIRLVAYLIDFVILFAVSFVLNFVMAAVMPEFLGAILNLIFGVTYFAMMESSANQGTVGKMAMGIKVGDAKGNVISTGNAVGRYFAKIISGLLLCIGYLMILWDDKKQGIHDKLADTYVYRK